MDFFLLAQCMWVCFIIIWIILSFSTKKAVEKESSTDRTITLVLYIASAILLFTRYVRLTSIQILSGIPYQILGVILCFVGLSFAVWARVLLGNNWSGRISVKEDHKFITKGPYAIVRHPIYGGILLAYLGTAVTAVHVRGYIAVLLMLTGMIIKLRREERFILEKLDRKYESYYCRVRYRLIPFIY